MFKKILFISFLFLIFIIITTEKVSAENGCGGNMWCGDSNDYVTYDCRIEGDSCNKYDTGIDSANCTATQDDCYADVVRYSCIDRVDVGCSVSTRSERVSCCTDGSGPGNQCPAGQQWTCEPVCKKESSCPPNNQGLPCCPPAPGGEARVWCNGSGGSCSCQPIPPSCTLSQPSELTITPVLPALTTSKATLNWTLGTGGTSQRIYIAFTCGKWMPGKFLPE